MKAPKCRLCQKEHWGACADSPSLRSLATKPAASRTSTPKTAATSSVSVTTGESSKTKSKETNAVKTKKKRTVSSKTPSPKSESSPKPKAKQKYAGADVKEITPRVITRPLGRPLAADAHLSAEKTKPWKRLKMSRRTYYRRKAVGTLLIKKQATA